MSSPLLTDYPLAVDLDGTLLKIDSMEEALRFLLLRRPWVLWRLLRQKLRLSRAEFKWALYKEVELKYLPWNSGLIDWLKIQKAQGRRLVLISATPQFYVEDIGRRLGGLFDDFVGSPQQLNLKSKKKAAYLQARFGDKGFDYVGNSRADVAVWRVAQRAYTVNDAPSLIRRAKRKKVPQIEVVAPHRSDTRVAYLRALFLPLPVLWTVAMAYAYGWWDIASCLALWSASTAGALLGEFIALERLRTMPVWWGRAGMAEGVLSVLTGANMIWVLLLLSGLFSWASGECSVGMASIISAAVMLISVAICALVGKKI
jgi:phosphoserine phosphatase